MSRAEQLLKAAEGFGPKEFTAADLTVVAWLAHKKSFGLRGFENLFPDSKVVAVELSRSKLLRERIAWVRTGVYRYAGA